MSTPLIFLPCIAEDYGFLKLGTIAVVKITVTYEPFEVQPCTIAHFKARLKPVLVMDQKQAKHRHFDELGLK